MYPPRSPARVARTPSPLTQEYLFPMPLHQRRVRTEALWQPHPFTLKSDEQRLSRGIIGLPQFIGYQQAPVIVECDQATIGSEMDEKCYQQPVKYRECG
jgi:hypothetical protein